MRGFWASIICLELLPSCVASLLDAASVEQRAASAFAAMALL